MTQNKNKKGIAKKALSISLVAAMLATSNVPVWASGFEAVDPMAEGFAVESAAPETEAVDAASESTVATASHITEGDLDINLVIDKTTVTWNTDTTADAVFDTGKSYITKKDSGEALANWGYAWKDGDIALQSHENVTAISDMNLVTTKEMAGKTLTLWLFRDDGAADFEINTAITVKVEKQELDKIAVTPKKLTYNGKEQDLKGQNVIVKTAAGDTVPDTEYTLSYSSASQAGQEVTVTASANGNSAYKGVVTSEPQKIQKATYVDGIIVPSVDENLSFEYTGDKIPVEIRNVHIRESKSETEGDGKLTGADLSSAITKAYTVASNVTDSSPVRIEFDGTQIKNIAVDDESVLDTDKVEPKTYVEITKRDLSDVQISIKNGAVADGSEVAWIKDVLIFSDGDNVLPLKDIDYSIEVTDAAGNPVNKIDSVATYYLTVRSAGNNTEGSQRISLPVEGNVVTDVTAEKDIDTVYTGSEARPDEEDIGDITITGAFNKKETISPEKYDIVGYGNNINATRTASNKGQAYVQIKVLDSTSFDGKIVNLYFDIDPLTVSANDVKVPATISCNKDYKEASEYGIIPTVVAKNGKVSKELTTEDFELTYKFDTENKIDHYVNTTVKITNDNYNPRNVVTTIPDKQTEIVAKALADSMIYVNPSSYVYTGGAIIPEYNVIDGSLLLYKDQEYTESITNNVNVGTGKIAITAIKDAEFEYSGSASATFEITPANINSVKVDVPDQTYNDGKQVRPRINEIKVTLNDNDVTDQFEITGYGENAAAGTGTLTLAPVKGNKNFTGTSLEVKFNIIAEKVTGTLTAYDKNGMVDNNRTFNYDGTAKTYAKTVLSNLAKVGSGTTTATVDDFEIKYVDNVTGAYDENGHNIAYVYAVAKEGTGFAGNDTITTADGTVIKGVVAKIPFIIEAAAFTAKNVTVNNGVYAGGLPVKPEVIVQYGGKTLVEGADYELDYELATDVTNSKAYDVTIKGIGGYSATDDIDSKWGIDKKDLADCDVTMENGAVTVKNGSLPVPAVEYTTTTNENGSVTVSAAKTSKNYTGSVTVYDSIPEAPASTVMSVTDRTTSTVTVNWDKVDGAEGYSIWYRSEYDTEMSRHIIWSGDETSWTVKGLQPGTKYFFSMRAWVKDAEGNYVFSEEQSPTQRGTTKPEAAKIIGISVENGKIQVRLAGKAAGAEMYSMCYGDSRTCFAANDFKVGIRTQYTTRTLNKTFEPGTYYVCVKSYRDLGNGKRVYGAWSNTFRAVVK